MNTSRGASRAPKEAQGLMLPLDAALERSPKVLWTFALALMGLGTWLRFHGLDAQSLWFDEILQARITRKPLGWILAHMPYDKPPLDYWLQHFAIRWGGETEWWIRFPAAVWATATMPVILLWARSMFGPTVGLTALALLTFSPLHIHYSQEGRPYALFILATALAAWSLWELTQREAGQWQWRMIHAFAVFVSLWTLYLTLVTVALMLLWLGALWLWTRRHRDALVSALIIWLMCLASLAVLVLRIRAEFSNTPDQAFDVLTPGDLAGILTPFVFGYSEQQHIGGALWWGIPTVLVGAVFGFLRRGAAMALVLTLCVGTMLSILLFYRGIGHWVEVRYMLGALLPWLMLEAIGAVAIAVGLSRIVSPRAMHRPVAAGLLSAALVSIAVFSTGHILTNPHRKMDWRRAAVWLSEHVQAGQRVLLTHPWHQIRLVHYFDRLNASVPLEIHPDPRNFRSRAGDLEDCWAFLTLDTDAPELTDWLMGYPCPRTGAEGIRIWRVHDPETWYARAPERLAASADRFASDGFRIEIGDESFAALGIGWGESERYNDEHPFRWAVDENPVLFLPLAANGEAQCLLMRAMTYDFPNARPQITSVRINGTDIGWGVIIPGWQVYGMEIPAGVMRMGLNSLEFEIDHTVSPSEIFAVPDRRRLGIGIDWVLLAGGERLGEADHRWPQRAPEGWVSP